MKIQLILIFYAMFLLSSCNKEDSTNIDPLKKISACGVQDPLNELKWLNDLANKSLTDKTGNYQGNIWIKNINGKDLIFTDMALGSGGILFYCFNCDGTTAIDPGISIFFSLTDDFKVFTSIKL